MAFLYITKSQKDSEVLTLHLVAVRRLARLRRAEARAVAEEARLARRLRLAQAAFRLDACPQWP